jgi:hypothetical protein
MADVDTKSGTYTIRAHATGVPGDPDSTFTFWWATAAMATYAYDQIEQARTELEQPADSTANTKHRP